AYACHTPGELVPSKRLFPYHKRNKNRQQYYRSQQAMLINPMVMGLPFRGKRSIGHAHTSKKAYGIFHYIPNIARNFQDLAHDLEESTERKTTSCSHGGPSSDLQERRIPEPQHIPAHSHRHT